MAYSDYGGYGYKNGVRVEDRSDAVLTDKGILSTPGMYPGFAFQEALTLGSYHVLLGDDPVFVGMHKQTSLYIVKDGIKLNLIDVCVDENPHLWEYNDMSYIDTDKYSATDEKCTFKVDDVLIEVHWVRTDNMYQLVKVTYPDGTVWHGFSGYGVGAGLEEAGYGYDTREVEQLLFKMLP